MARIRSIHPGIWTDEAFMSLSAHARLLLIGLWTEAYDDGVFEWKSLTLKARIFPVDNVDINELLLELVSSGHIARLERHAKQPGIIRNFQRYQRPKKPNSSGMLSEEWLEYVGATASAGDGSEQVPNRSGTSTENHSQMEDGGGNRREETVPDGTAAPAPLPIDYRNELWTNGVASLVAITGKTPSSAKSMVGKFLRDTKDDARCVLEAIQHAHRERIIDPIPWIARAIACRSPQKPPDLADLFKQQAQNSQGYHDDGRTIEGSYERGDFDGSFQALPGIAAS